MNTAFTILGIGVFLAAVYLLIAWQMFGMTP